MLHKTKIGPGLYRVGDSMHIDVPEMLRHFGYADNEANREVLAKAAVDACRSIYPKAARYMLTEGQLRHVD